MGLEVESFFLLSLRIGFKGTCFNFNGWAYVFFESFLFLSSTFNFYYLYITKLNVHNTKQIFHFTKVWTHFLQFLAWVGSSFSHPGPIMLASPPSSGARRLARIISIMTKIMIYIDNLLPKKKLVNWSHFQRPKESLKTICQFLNATTHSQKPCSSCCCSTHG